MEKPTKKEIEQIFLKGFGKIKTFVVTDFGLSPEYIKNPKMTQAQLKKAPTYTVEATAEMREKAIENKAKYDANQPKEISILEFAKKVAKANKGKITHKSKSGSVYLLIAGKTVRISNHYILDRDAFNPKERHDYEIVKRGFDENDSPLISFK
ncbi:hypothetical protein [Flavobacterium sp. UBA4197]|uniref:hypothetical protein n=1 Tax=Flavobacterium sp. UBA4197 TaxID=1946546 RepID=UPI00257BABE1|nr:hypothetical protein [Flavobacterium sp. UBA4197]